MIDIIIPTLGRPHKLQHVVDNVRLNTIREHIVVFAVEEDDLDSQQAGAAAGGVVVINTRSRSYAGAVNTAYHNTSSEWLFCGDDSLDFRYGWDETALSRYGDGRHGVIGINDLNNPYSMAGTNSTIHLVHRKYLDEHGGVIDGGPGSFLYEGYNHYYVDTEFTDTAIMRGTFVPCLDSHVHHLHWASNSSVPFDETSAKNESKIPEDERTYSSRRHLWSK